MKKVHFLIFIFFLFLFQNCRKTNEYKIAVALPLTGDLASLNEGILRAINLAATEEKEVIPFPVKIVPYDDRADPREGVAVAKRISSDKKVLAVIGHFNSGVSIPAAQIYARAGILMITPAASNPKLTYQQLDSEPWINGAKKNVFRTNTIDDVQGRFGAEYMFKKLKVRAASIIHDKTAYGQGIADEFKKDYLEIGGRVLSYDGIQVGDRDFIALLTKIKTLNPQGVYFGGIFNEGALIVKQAKEVGLGAAFLLSEANLDPEFLNIAGDSARDTYVTFLGAPPEQTPTAKQFIKSYREKYPDNEIKAYDHYGYEATKIALEAIKNCGTDRSKIIDYLRSIKYKGVLGVTKFDEKGDTLNKKISVFKVKDKKFVFVE
ncbi:MAG: branched-chain amino acid ABC transporter substrate-binding protein [Elusimicrobiota bacterium]